MSRFVTVLLVMACSAHTPAFAGGLLASITGSVHDKDSGEELVGANILVVGTSKGTTTDLDGKFELRGVEPGTVSLRFSYVGYASQTVTNATVAPGEALNLDVLLQQEGYKSEEVVVTAQKILSTEAALLSERRRAATIGDGISAELMKKSPDATSGDALKRVTGLLIVDNKYVVVRGITDRYNGTTLDGATVASTDEGKKGFSFDLVPANLLENTVVVKSATPELPGDFTGGLVQMSTLDFPDRFVARIGTAASYNSITGGTSLLRTQGGREDWTGRDDGTRKFPDGVAGGDPAALARAMPNSWAPRFHPAPLNGSLSLAMGDRLAFGTDDETGDQLGFIGALSYTNGVQRSLRILNDVSFSRLLTGTHDAYHVLWGGIANVAYKFGGLHKLAFKNSYNRSAEDEVRRYHSNDGNTGQQYEYTIIDWTERSVYSGQLSGEHSFPELGGSTLLWRATASSSHRQDPDRKEASYYRQLDAAPSDPYYAATNQRSWSHLNDRTLGAHVDVTIPYGEIRFKAGGVLEHGETNFGIRYFNVEGSFGIADSLLRLPLESIYAPANFGPGKFGLRESSKPTDTYTGDRSLDAVYCMMDIPFQVFDQRLRVVGGVRFEQSDIHVNVPRGGSSEGLFERIRLMNHDFLPSVNLTYAVADNANIRLAYAESVNRPEFRELAPASYFDFVTYETVGGNPGLQRAYVHNYDCRAEVFPGVGRVLAVSVFHKVISGAIEEELIQTATRTRTWFNSSRAENSGYELEARTTLGFLGDFWENFNLTGNYTRVHSRVDYIRVEGNSLTTTFSPATRPMQGQSPYMINLALTWSEPALGTSVSVFYNKFGRRLMTVGFLADDIYEEPRDMVDIAVTQSLWAGLQAKLSVKNLGAKDRVLTRGDAPYEGMGSGRTFGFSLSMNL